MSKKDEDSITSIIIGGEDWPEISAKDVHEQRVPDRDGYDQGRNVALLTVILGGLFLIYTTYAMMRQDLDMLRGGFDFVKLALAASVSWTFGRRSMPSP